MNSETHFTPLDDKEKRSKLQQLAQKSVEIKLWLKGQKEKITVTPRSHLNEKSWFMEVNGDPALVKKLVDKEVLSHFQLRNVQFFTTAKVAYDKMNNIFQLFFEAQVFKHERRRSFRLLTFPGHQVKVTVTVPKISKVAETTNILHIAKNNKLSTTKLFKEFMTLLESSDENDTTHNLTFRVQDISTSGLSFIIGEIEKQYLLKDQKFKKFKLSFNEEDFTIPEAKVVYIIDYIDPQRAGSKLFKLGLQFENLPLKLDDVLSKKISKEMREFENFEDFIK